MEFRPATQEDLDFVKQNPFEGALKDYPYMEVPDEHTYTIIFQGKIVGVGGLVIHWPGMGELWLILTANCPKDGVYGIIALNAIQSKVEELVSENNIRRAQVTVRTDFPKAVEMIEFLGFKNEGVMPCYCPDGSDVFRYSRTERQKDEFS